MTDDTTQDWPGTETWLCEGCDEPKPTDECWPCETDDGRLVLCPDCRDERDVEPVTLTDGGDAQCGRDTEHNFPFNEGDEVLVRVREHGTSGNIVAKFEGECAGITNGVGPGSAKARFDFDWGLMNSVTLRSHEAEFEVVE